ncbi:MAG: GtrA family protein [Bacteroidales bacterium]
MINRKDKKGEFIRYIITGTVATAVQYGVYYLLCATMQPHFAFTLATVAFVVVNFFMTNYYTFRVKPTWKNSIGFLGQQGINYVMQIGFLSLFLWMGISAKLAPVPVYLIALPTNFVILRFIFKKKVF